VTFTADVLPIFQTSCAFSSSCHGTHTGPAGKTYFGPGAGTPASETDIDAIFEQNVNADAVTEPDMKRIAPAVPERSFILHKIDGTFSCGVLKCAAEKTCGVRMPATGTALADDKADAIRRWIAQGAQRN
jgi:hypothetical protein